MQVTFIVLGSVFVLFLLYVAYIARKMKKIPDAPTSAKIRILNNSNFKSITKNGITLVDFWAPWCAPCRMMAPVLNEIAEMNELKMTVAKLNVDLEQQLAMKYKVRSIPTLILFNKGKEEKRFVGIKSRNFLVSEINRLDI